MKTRPVRARHRRGALSKNVKVLLLDAGGTLVFPNFRRIAREFAKDGVVVDPEALARAEAAIRFEIDRADLIRSTKDAQRWTHYLQKLLGAVKITRIPFAAMARLKAYHDRNNLWDFVPEDVPAALRKLGARYRLGVISNSNGTVRALLKRVGLAEHFEVIVDSHEEGIEKPDPRLFRIALDRMEISASQAAYVGDLYHVDVLGARRAGLTPVLLDPLNFYSRKRVARIRHLGEITGFPFHFASSRH